jgi:uncharacterized membrane protein
VALGIALNQRREIRDLRRMLESSSSRGASPSRPETASRLDPAPSPRPAATVPAAATPQPTKARDLEALIGGQWLTWFGILAIFFGTAFFLAQNLGEHVLAGVGQVLVGVVVSALFIGIGRALAARAQWILGRGLLAGGVTLLFLSAYASSAFHELVPVTVVHAVLVAVAAIGAALALGQRSLSIASLTLLCALLTPPLLEGDIDPTRVLLPYLIAVNAGTAWVAARGRWPALSALAFLGTLILVIHWWSHHYATDRMLTAFLGVTPLWALFAFGPVARRAAATDRAAAARVWWVAESLVVALSGLSYAWFLYVLLGRFYADLRGLATLTLAFVYVLSARLAARRGRAALPTSAQHYTGLAVAIIAVPIQFDAAWTTLAWTLIGFVLVAAGVRHQSVFHRWIGLAVYVMSAFRVLVFDAPTALQSTSAIRPIANASFIVGALVAAVLAVTARLYHRHRVALSPIERPLITTLAVAAPALLLVRVSVESLATFAARERLMNTPGSLRLAALLTLSFIWVIFAAVLVAAGFLAKYRPLRILGFVILGVLLLKVFLVDTQSLDRGYRIASFLGVGIFLLVISIFYQRGRRRA